MKRLLSVLLATIMIFSSLASSITLEAFAGSNAAFEYSNIVANTNVSYPFNDDALTRMGCTDYFSVPVEVYNRLRNG